jgi:hypothetical protein
LEKRKHTWNLFFHPLYRVLWVLETNKFEHGTDERGWLREGYRRKTFCHPVSTSLPHTFEWLVVKATR